MLEEKCCGKLERIQFPVFQASTPDPAPAPACDDAIRTPEPAPPAGVEVENLKEKEGGVTHTPGDCIMEFPARNFTLACIRGRCQGINEKRNLYNAYRWAGERSPGERDRGHQVSGREVTRWAGERSPANMHTYIWMYAKAYVCITPPSFTYAKVSSDNFSHTVLTWNRAGKYCHFCWDPYYSQMFISPLYKWYSVPCQQI